MANTYALSVVGADEPGIVAAITEVLLELNCNLADTNMSVLSGHFSMVLIVDAPMELLADRLEHELERVTRRFQLLIAAHHVAHGELPALTALQPTHERVLVTVYGADQPGIVHGVVAVIANLKSNIVDLRTQRFSEAQPLYSLFMEVQLGENVSRAALSLELQAVAQKCGVRCTLSSIDETDAL